jgi:serine/threonine protein kinase
MIKINQFHAYFGDKDAARHLLLPCYKPLFRSLWCANLLLIFIQLLFLLFFSDNSSTLLICIQFCEMSSLALQSIPAILLCQPSVSISGFWRTGVVIFSWWLLSTLVWILSSHFPFIISIIVFILITALPPCLLSLLTLFGFLPSRIQLGSRSNRSCLEFLLFHSLAYLLALLFSIFFTYPIHLAYGLMIFFSSLIFPAVLYSTLLADTKFWRGLGKHNSGGIVPLSSSTSRSLPLPELTMAIVANEFQTLLSEIGPYFIDFAFVRVGPLIGSGGSAEVYLGEYKGRPVALKVSTPPEVTASELLIIRKETLIHSKLSSHPCIVTFVGVCIRPPQIGILVEYCEQGNLRESLQKQFFLWTTERRMRALLDACRAVCYLHTMGYMHRDIKAENFFVTQDWKVKLGDFGEAVEMKSYHQQSNGGGVSNVEQRDTASVDKGMRPKMTIIGTIAYMAPELVEGKRWYTESIDVYALTITLWQIWTGQEPYENIETFSLYQLIASGTHPPFPQNSPEGFNEILTQGWNPNSEQRISSKDLLVRVDSLVNTYLQELHSVPVSAATAASSSHSVSSSSVTGENGDHTIEENPLAIHTRNSIPHEALEMLGFSSVFDDCPASFEYEEFQHLHPPSSHTPHHPHHNPLKVLRGGGGWKQQQHSPLKSAPTTPTRARFLSFFSSPIAGDGEDEGEEKEEKVNEMDLYQSYARQSITEPKQNPILSFFNPNKFQRVR